MKIDDRAKAIKRAKRALKAITDHPDTSQQQLGAARDWLNDCFRLTESAEVWEAVEDIEAIASAVYGVPEHDELSPRAVGRWVSPRGCPGPAKPRRARRTPHV